MNERPCPRCGYAGSQRTWAPSKAAPAMDVCSVCTAEERADIFAHRRLRLPDEWPVRS